MLVKCEFQVSELGINLQYISNRIWYDVADSKGRKSIPFLGYIQEMTYITLTANLLCMITRRSQVFDFGQNKFSLNQQSEVIHSSGLSATTHLTAHVFKELNDSASSVVLPLDDYAIE